MDTQQQQRQRQQSRLKASTLCAELRTAGDRREWQCQPERRKSATPTPPAATTVQTHIGVLQHQQARIAAVRLHLGLRVWPVDLDVAPHAVHHSRVEVVCINLCHTLKFEGVPDGPQAGGGQALQHTQALSGVQAAAVVGQGGGAGSRQGRQQRAGSSSGSV